MIGFLLKKIFGTRNEREIKRVSLIVDRINAQEASIEALSDADLRAKTDEFKGRLEQGQNLDDLLPEAFAVVREASKRTLGMRHFDVQLIGGIILHEGRIAEMKTGEGKTLVATLPVYLNALTGRGVHVVTVNDYLARRDAQWMSPVYTFLGLSVGVIVHGLNDEQRQQAYNSDITYGTNNEFGFDYLRDNMKFDLSEYAQRELNFAIVDEVDSILVDEARTPLIISGPAEESTDKYYKINRIIPSLKMDVDYTIEEKTKTAALTEEGNIKVEKLLNAGNLYDPENVDLVHHVHQALKAHTLFQSDVDYVVKDGQVMIVDEFTGRLMPGRRWSDGLHQAIEAKEGVPIQRESKTLATISFQNYFRMYGKLAGMTGTASTEAEEFGKIYNLEVLIIPTNEKLVRNDYPDLVYKSVAAKFKAVSGEIEEAHKRGQPVLVGTTSIEKNELLSKLLKRKNIPHELLNAKHHEKEAHIIAQAGKRGAVTVATNMAGRGVDIKLDDEVKKLGGLHIIGPERHESRRIDNQLRGRSGRQGDPGSSRFFVSLQDDLMRIFGGATIEGLMTRFGIEEDVPLESRLVSGAIENAQKRVEGYNFDLRKHLVEYDDVMNKHREVAYTLRRKVLIGGEEMTDFVLGKIEPFSDKIQKIWDDYGKEFGKDWFAIARQLTLQVFDQLWIEHISTMAELREGIGLRGYGGRDPLVEYKKEARNLFDKLIGELWAMVAERFEKVEIKRRSEVKTPAREVALRHPTANYGQEVDRQKIGGEIKPKDGTKKIGRNDPCPCGSGLKWKKCGLINAPQHRG